MALTAAQKRQCIGGMISSDPGPFNCARADLLTALDDIDTWATNNAAAFNTAINAAARTSLTASQKALLLAEVCKRRAGL